MDIHLCTSQVIEFVKLKRIAARTQVKNHRRHLKKKTKDCMKSIEKNMTLELGKYKIIQHQFFKTTVLFRFYYKIYENNF